MSDKKPCKWCGIIYPKDTKWVANRDGNFRIKGRHMDIEEKYSFGLCPGKPSEEPGVLFPNPPLEPSQEAKEYGARLMKELEKKSRQQPEALTEEEENELREAYPPISDEQLSCNHRWTDLHPEGRECEICCMPATLIDTWRLFATIRALREELDTEEKAHAECLEFLGEEGERLKKAEAKLAKVVKAAVPFDRQCKLCAGFYGHYSTCVLNNLPADTEGKVLECSDIGMGPLCPKCYHETPSDCICGTSNIRVLTTEHYEALTAERDGLRKALEELNSMKLPVTEDGHKAYLSSEAQMFLSKTGQIIQAALDAKGKGSRK